MRTETLSDKAYHIIKQKLITSDNGVFLSARQYANELKMSYTPVREAFLRLNKEGLLELVPNVGFFMTRLDTKDIMEIFQVRECLELFVLRKIFNNITDEHIKALEKCVEEQRNKLASNSIYEYMDADERFHMLFIEIYNNQHIMKFYQNVREKYLVCSKDIAMQHSYNAIEEHLQLIKSIEDKDLEGAVTILALHIENTKQRVKDGYIRIMD